MLTPEQLDKIEYNYMTRPCIWGGSWVLGHRNCSSKYSLYTSQNWVQQICDNHIDGYKEHFNGIKVIELSEQDIFYLKITKC